MLQDKLGADFEVSVQEPNFPKLKIMGISNDMNKDKIDEDVNLSNFYEFKNKFKIVLIMIKE